MPAFAVEPPGSMSLLLAPVRPPDGGIVAAKGQRFLAEVATTPQAQARGLMYRRTWPRTAA